MSICVNCVDREGCDSARVTRKAAPCYRPDQRLYRKRRPKLCWGNFNWGFLVAMLLCFAAWIWLASVIGSLLEAKL
jgi:hypothetical protein